MERGSLDEFQPQSLPSPLPRRARRRPVDERLELLVVVRQRLGQREEPPDGILRAGEAHFDPVPRDFDALGQAGEPSLERLDRHGHADPGQPRRPELGQEPLPACCFAAEGGPRPVFPELAEELCSRERSLVAGELGPEGLHERRRPGSRDAEELLDVAAREQLAVQRLELADGVGDGEEPPGLGRYLVAPCRLQPLRRVRVGKMYGAHTVR